MNKRMFILTDGNRFIKQDVDGKYKQTTNLSLADTWDSHKVAEAVLKNSIPRSLSSIYYVAEIVNDEIVKRSNPATRREKKRTGDVIRFNNSFGDSEWCKCFEGLDLVFEKAFKRGYELSQEIQDIDLEISDVVHYIEFNNLNAREGYKIYKKLNELLCKRRSLKFEQRVVTSINSNHKAIDYINNIISTINDCKKDVYKPRILADLFKEGGLDVGK